MDLAMYSDSGIREFNHSAIPFVLVEQKKGVGMNPR